jgi:hypothetical protein
MNNTRLFRNIVLACLMALGVMRATIIATPGLPIRSVIRGGRVLDGAAIPGSSPMSPFAKVASSRSAGSRARAARDRRQREIRLPDGSI